MNKIPKSLSNANIANKTVLVRVDFDVPFNNGSIIDDTKIRAAIPTIQLLLKNNCKVILLSHLGDPKGKQDDTLSLMDVRFVLGRLLEKQIKFANIAACENSIKFMDFGEVLLLENLRFSPFETTKKSEDRASYVEV
ncbi:phosphoglycerate kinase, partial [Candidatus Dojkabacteria bacterium]|nr:phosphoglycerate kinase [Candidatus Dojkabacteria bacterium]